DQADALARLSSRCAELGVRFGVGLSPFEVREFGAVEREALGRKLAFFDGIGVRDLAILFDDMRGDVPGLAERQLEVVDWAAGRTAADRIIVCPSYYTDDPVLDRVFGQRPAGYIEALGAGLDPRIEIFWTGEEVCSYELSPGHLRRVAEQLRRKPFLWDNYPVNDGQRMSQFLHVRGFTGRPAQMAGLIAAHGINPALQAILTCIPALTLVESYRRGDAYEYGAATLRAAVQVLGEELGTRLYEDMLFLQDVGLDRLEAREAELRGRWAGVDHPAAREIIAWLDGGYRITDEIVQTQ
ncbi:MAG TPA: beta-N-acetylglucosaminidase domain-containing protein, partial [Longimicrobium sp.]|nr:beta-N-acetylglucosaminidase domain-containing protein [Longimicrobium sp.]